MEHFGLLKEHHCGQMFEAVHTKLEQPSFTHSMPYTSCLPLLQNSGHGLFQAVREVYGIDTDGLVKMG